MAYKLIYNPLIDYIRSHVCLCAILIHSMQGFQFMYSGMVYCDMQAKSICICAYGGFKVGLLYNNAGNVI